MITNYGEVPDIRIDNISCINNISKDFDKKFLQDNGFCIFNKKINSPESLNIVVKNIFEENFNVLSQSKDSRRYTIIKPQKGSNIFVNNDKFQPLHSDNAHSGSPPNFIALICMYNSKSGGESFIKRINLPFLSDELMPLINEEVVYRKNNIMYKVKIIDKTDDGFVVNYSPFVEFCSLKSMEQYKAFVFLIDTLSSLETLQYKLKSGDIMVLNNRKNLHGRAGFLGDRKLIRLWLA